MQFLLPVLVSLVTLLTTVLGAGCQPHSALLGLPVPSNNTLPGEYTLWARDASGKVLPVVESRFPQAGGFFYPLSLGKANASQSDPGITTIVLSNGRAYNGGEVVATMQPYLLTPIPLFVAADSSQTVATAAAIQADCDGTTELLLRFYNLLQLPLQGGYLNSTFAEGTGLNSPSVTGLLALGGTPVDLILRSYDG